MARIEISFFTTGNRSLEGGTMPVARMEGMVTEVLTSSTTSVATTKTSVDADGTGFVRIQPSGDVWVTAGAAPVAAVPTSGQQKAGMRVRANGTADFAVRFGEKVAVIDA